METELIGLCLAMAVAGTGLGLFSGIAPGIHVNTLASMLAASYPLLAPLLSGVDASHIPLAVGCCIMSASVVHSFVDFVPSVFIGAPDGEDAVSVLPGHKLLLKGRGMDAVRAAAIGSLIGASATILMAVPLQWILISGLGDFLEKLTPVVLIIATATLLLGEARKRNAVWGTVAFVLSGMLGLACMTRAIPTDGVIGEGSIMLPLLTGLFGIPILLETSSESSIPHQIDRCDDPVGMVPGFKGVLMGTVAGWFPGITSTVGAAMSAMVFPENRPERFISTVASVGTVTSVLSIVTLSVSGNGRSGTALAIGEICGDELNGFMSEGFLLMLMSAAVASMIGYWMTIASGKAMSRVVGRLDPKVMSRTVLVALVCITLALTGPAGLLILVCSSVVGMIPPFCSTGRLVLCGCLLMPVLLFKLGLA